MPDINKDKYVSFITVYKTVLGNNEELYQLFENVIKKDPKLEDFIPILVKSLYNYNINDEKLQKLWESSCNQNLDLFKLTLFLLNSYDCGFQFGGEKTRAAMKADQIVYEAIQKNMEQENPISFVENPDANYGSILTDDEKWDNFCLEQAEYLVASFSDEKKHVR